MLESNATHVFSYWFSCSVEQAWSSFGGMELVLLLVSNPALADKLLFVRCDGVAIQE